MARIMIVDDSGMMRSLLRLILEKAGHTVVAEAATGKEAYLEYSTHRPDLVTMDITMPTWNGIETIRSIRADFPEAKIIVVSSIGQKMKVIEAVQSGAKHYIIKPFTSEIVIQVVNDVLKNG